VLIVCLTTSGKALIKSLFPQHAAALVEFMNALNPEEQKSLGSLCRKLGQRDVSEAR